MASGEYWIERSLKLNENLLGMGDKLEKELAIEFEKALSRIQKEIEAFYTQFATDNKISYADAKRVLTTAEKRRFMLDVDDYIKKAETYPYTPEFDHMLRNASVASRVTRLQSLQIQMHQQTEELYTKYHGSMVDTAEKVFTQGYYRSIYDIQSSHGFGSPFATLDTETVKNVIAKPWAPDGTNFSEKIWQDREELVNFLDKELTQEFIRGEGPDRLIKEIQTKFGVTSRNAARLVQTEMSYFATAAKLESYKAMGYERYIINAIMDGKTSVICEDMHNRVIEMTDYYPGITAPPFHPRCRTAIAPYAGSRESAVVYKDGDDVYVVPEDMTFEQWYEKHVENSKAYDTINLTDSEHLALNRYISSDSYKINDKLRHGLPLSDAERENIENLNKALDKMPEYKGEAIRTIHLQGEALTQFINKYQQGNIIQEDAFTSFSKADDYDDEANIRIGVISEKAKDISAYNPAEQEAIYKSGSKFFVKMLSVLEGIIYLVLEER